MLLEVDDLHAGYGRRQVLFGISMGVEQGSVTAILGTNGAGKSSTLKALMGAVKVSSGTVRFEGADVTNRPVADNVTRGMSLVPEAGGVFRDFTVRENLTLGAFTVSSHALVAERLETVFDVFPRLKDRIGQRAGTLSGGERQMLAIGRALMSGPTCLMLDEPFLGLAPAVVDVVIDAMVRINREAGVTLLVVEQNVRVLDIATQAYVLRLGQILIDEPDPKRLINDTGRLEASFIA